MPRHVSHYQVTRHRGGPEEGGWYYDRHEFVAVIQTFHEFSTHSAPQAQAEAKRLADTLNSNARKEHRQPARYPRESPDHPIHYQGRFSVANHTDDYYYVETIPGFRDDSKEPRPIYQ